MTERKNIKLDTETYQALREEKKSIETWHDLFTRLLAEQDSSDDTDDDTEAIDYAEIESRCKRAVEAALPEGRGR